MFVMETQSAKVARKAGIMAAIAFVLTGSFGVLLTMHIYVKPSRPQPTGLRFFGFPRSKH